MLFVDEAAFLQRLDRIILLLEDMAKKPSLAIRIANGAATGVGILSIFSVIEVIKSWIKRGTFATLWLG